MDGAISRLILGIDASNLRLGGGVTHLVELLRAADPQAHGFSQVVVWSGKATLDCIEDRSWLVKVHQTQLDKRLLHRVYWQRVKLSDLARAADCSVLFVPGGSYAGNFNPVITMSRNLLPFEWVELRRYGLSLMMLKLMALRRTQSQTFRLADGLIFLTQYAQDTVMRVIGTAKGKTTIIPHGIYAHFNTLPKNQWPVNKYSAERPYQILYVSIVDTYKHQWQVAEAVAQLRNEGFPVALELVGPAYSPALQRLKRTLERVDPLGDFIRYAGAVSYADLPARYARADLFLFASSCENMPNILLEGMASGLPIACSNCGPMPEILGDAGIYFDPERPEDVARAIRELIESPFLRARKAAAAFERAKAYSWIRCADDTFGFLAGLAVAHSHVASLAS
ncbi:MAG: glycosyltransferase family 1 protein [Syntrophus sp. (in: bacteria)]